MRVQCGMKVPDREITRVGNKMCAKRSRERGDEKRGRRQRKYSGRLGCTWRRRARHCASHPAVTCTSCTLGPTPISLYRHDFRYAAWGFSGISESSNPASPVFSNSSNPRPVRLCLVFGDCRLLSVSPAGDRCRRFER